MQQIHWETIGISNDFMFGKVMRNPELCKELVETILDIEIDHVEYPEEQKTIDITRDARSVRLDVYLSDGKGTVFDIEMQTSDTGELPKRSRYYQGMLDLNLIEKGESYKKLNRSFIIFICTFDIFEKGRHIYSFENMCREEPGLKLEDGTAKIFLNANSRMDDVSEKLRAFLDYVAGRNSEDSFVKKLEEAVQKARSNQEWRREYMTLLMRDQENIEKGFEQGIKQGVEQGIKQGVEQGIKQGVEQGIKQGVEQGLQQGVQKEKLQTAFNLLREQLPLELIAKITGFSEEKVKEVQRMFLQKDTTPF